MLAIILLVVRERVEIGYPYTLRSSLAKRIERHQSDCTLPSALYTLGAWAGLGSDLHVWGETLCKQLEHGVRVQSEGPWQWSDSAHCNKSQGLGCYFPLNETHCRRRGEAVGKQTTNDFSTCPSIIYDSASKHAFRAAATEYLFSSGFQPFVLDEIKRQISEIFGDRVPDDLITVHMRWGDKKAEMELVKVQKYIDAVSTIVQRRTRASANVFLSTEDPKALKAFVNAAPSEWRVYGDAMVERMSAFRPLDGNHAVVSALNSHGAAGTVSLASLAIAMKANDYVLTTGSNWSRLMNELRKNVIDPRCNECTMAIDLRKGEW